MRIALGLFLLMACAGCTSCRTGACGNCTPCGSGGAGCGPVLCCEHHCYCRLLDDWHTTLSAKRCAHMALDGFEGRDYRLGFTQAFVDIALGRTGAPPPVPPQRYWSVCFRSACGEGRVSQWYAGYQDGAAMAAGRCGSRCRTIPVAGGGSGLSYASGHAGFPGDSSWDPGPWPQAAPGPPGACACGR